MSQQSAPEEGSASQQMVGQSTSVPLVQAQVSSQSVAPHLLGFLSNPTLAAAASSAPLFPGITMLNNPEALIGLPGMYRGHHMMQPGINISSSANAGDCQGSGFSQSQIAQQQHPQYLQQILPNQHHQQLLAPSTVNAQQMMSQNYAFQVPVPSTLGGVSIPPVPPHSSTAMQVQIAAAAAAVAAAPLKGSQQSISQRNDEKNKQEKCDLTPQEKARQNRDRNREHARSTRLRKKAYVQKLKELVEGLHVQRTEEVRKRRVAIQHLSELQSVRRAVVRSFLHFHSSNESDERKWLTILEDNAWLRQPVTPYRSFRRAEVEQECRVTRGIEAIVSDSASLSVMVEGVGSRSSRWMQLKREEVLRREGMRPRYSHMPYSIGDDSQQQTGVSSLSSSSGSSNGSGEEEERQKASLATQMQKKHKVESTISNDERKKVSSSSGSSHEERSTQMQGSNDFHVYNAPELPDPMLGDSEGSSPSDSPEESNAGQTQRINKHACTDSSSGEEDKLSSQKVEVPPSKRRKFDDDQEKNSSCTPMSSDSGSSDAAVEKNSLPVNIAQKGGISHNIKPNFTHQNRNGNGRLKLAPAIPLPPFVGIGKKAKISTAAGMPSNVQDLSQTPNVSSSNIITTPQEPLSSGNPFGPTTVSSSSTRNPTTVAIRADLAPSSFTAANIILPDSGDSSSQSSNNTLKIRAYYHVNEDDMLLTDDILMCPFVFRTQGAVMCGALSECVMPGMLRCHFSQLNKLLSVEMVYDAMGFMQQLERACGSDNLAQVVPGSLEMALAPNSHEARVITLSKHPFLIVSVNEAWTKMTKYSQMEVEGKCLSILSSPGSDPNPANLGKSIHNFDGVAKGKSQCFTNVHYNKEGKTLVDFVCSYPLTNSSDEITHLLHVFTELQAPTSHPYEFQESCSNESDSSQNQ